MVLKLEACYEETHKLHGKVSARELKLLEVQETLSSYVGKLEQVQLDRDRLSSLLERCEIEHEILTEKLEQAEVNHLTDNIKEEMEYQASAHEKELREKKVQLEDKMNIISLLERKLRKCEAICLQLKTNAKLSEENPHQIEYEENMELLSEKNDQWPKQEEMLIRLEKDVSNFQVELTTGNLIDEKSISQLEDQIIKKQKLLVIQPNTCSLPKGSISETSRNNQLFTVRMERKLTTTHQPIAILHVVS